MPDKTINDEITKPEKEDKEKLMKDKNKRQKKVKTKSMRKIEIIKFTIILSFGYSFIGNLLATSTFRLIDEINYYNIYLLGVSVIGLIILSLITHRLIVNQFGYIDEKMRN